MREVDKTTAMLRNPFCPDSVVVTEYYIPGTEPTQECTLHSPFAVDSSHIAGPVQPGAIDPNAMGPAAAAKKKKDSIRINDVFKLPP